ncbi:hypothetical protein R2970_001854 [Enterobacter cloacae]|uniref:hypothetical protein n=1 Tax=Enterobacter cloacae TaxID=550 RepID=UPI001C5B1172|nr:hypothetical protein [Enterobacter cloacae]ELQ9012513.1 hypothetical protein [Enterobacter cloacae]MBW4197807.1 hypothetical protein [Enterobacter cloacae subsp. cloacae]
MKKLLLLVFISFHSMATFSGHWVDEDNSQSLTLDLIESGTHLTGKYCFITNNGNRIDCAEGDEENINGVIKNNVGVVSFESTFGGTGEAILSVAKEILTYTIVDSTPFTNANMSMPKVIFFKKTTRAIPKESLGHEGCGVDETLVASCELSGAEKKLAMFCANNNNAVRYIFRNINNGNVELEFKFNAKNKLKRWLDLGTYTTYFGFNKGTYSYVLGVPEEKPGVVAFLDVKKNGKTISSKECSSNSFGEKNIRNNSIEDVLDSSVRDNAFKFP